MLVSSASFSLANNIEIQDKVADCSAQIETCDKCPDSDVACDSSCDIKPDDFFTRYPSDVLEEPEMHKSPSGIKGAMQQKIQECGIAALMGYFACKEKAVSWFDIAYNTTKDTTASAYNYLMSLFVNNSPEKHEEK